jgi:NADH-quinone oxidoreductase subunit G
MDTVTLTIDGRQLTVEKGKTVLQAALDHGIAVPYYCYHPALGVDGSCRVCIVKVEKMPKLQTACSTVCSDGMVVETRSTDVVEARAGVFEFLLINHPLDCPVCDKGGECPLQDFSYTFGPSQSRMEFPRRVFDGEGARADVDFGPTLMLNRNRCILCTRCVRFMRDVDGDAQIGIVDRGYASEIATFEERGVHSLISGNLMDVCPVGAILTRDYRFKSRPWDNPDVVDTICTLCSKGCNTSAWIKAKPEWVKAPQLVRMTPRLNPDVNGYWMCDLGRFDYHWVEGETRLRRPMVRARTGQLAAAGWQDAMRRIREELVGSDGPDPRLRFLVSAHASHEELFLVGRMAEGLAGGAARDTVSISWRHREKVQPPGTRFRVPAIDAPNVRGARDLGFNVTAANAQSASAPEDDAAPDLSALRPAIERGEVCALFVLDSGPDGSIGDVEWVVQARQTGQLSLLIVEGVVMTDLARAADVVLPGAAWVEKDAVYTNETGRVQGAARVIGPPGEAVEDWHILVNVARALDLSLPYTTSAQIRADLAKALADQPAYAGIGSLVFAQPLPARSWLQASNPSERWKWDFLFRDLPPVKGSGGWGVGSGE